MQTRVAHVLAVALLALWLQSAAVTAQLQFSEDWTHGKRDVSAQLRRPALPAAQAPRQPSLLDLLTSAGQQAEDTCRPDAEALGLIYDLVMREVEKVINCRTQKGLLQPYVAT
ncbi:uncharacterized protein LOC119112386 [Pollicipes pollicipes]|uniref:uncharacterized protein LOC119112386 n=1 Tax=Pollicipes pollicipes TaxID=41117 RepID=UPI001884A372|nr:uncharacterized protein LOC119112386 [Pollicipes pollicipes]